MLSGRNSFMDQGKGALSDFSRWEFCVITQEILVQSEDASARRWLSHNFFGN